MTVALTFRDCPVVELRRYRLRAGALADLVTVFERHLIEPQEQAGMALGGIFADEDDADVFTWLRGFAGHDARVRALAAFYGGPAWARHRDAANATMLDSDDVLLLRATQPAHPPAAPVPRGEPGGDAPGARVLVGTYGLEGTRGLADDADGVERWFAADAVPALANVLQARLTAWRTDPTPNGFPGLPVRSERALAWLAVFPDGDLRDRAAARLAVADVGRELRRRTDWEQILRLAPTARSAHPAPGAPPRLPAPAAERAAG